VIFFIPTLKNTFKNKRSNDVEATEYNVMEQLFAIKKSGFEKCF
jgi:hypothetical protein